MQKVFVSGTLLFSLALSACSLAPNFHRPQMAIPDGWSSVPGIAAKSQPNRSPLWEDLGREDLNRVMKVALAQNLDLEAALHRVEQGRAQAKVAGAALYPSLEGSGRTSRSYQDPGNVNAARGLGSINYELDLWGKNRNQKAAANYRAGATQYDRDAVRLIVTADTAAFYTHVLSLNERIRIAESNLKNAEEILRIIEARYGAGSVSGLEVSQQKVAVNSLRAALANLVQARST